MICISVPVLLSQSYRNVADSVKRRTLRYTFILYYYTQCEGGWYFFVIVFITFKRQMTLSSVLKFLKADTIFSVNWYSQLVNTR